MTNPKNVQSIQICSALFKENSDAFSRTASVRRVLHFGRSTRGFRPRSVPRISRGGDPRLPSRDALHREESCGGHFRVEYQDAGEAKRNDDEFAYVAAWEYAGENAPQILNKEPLMYENVHLSTRSYK